MTKIPGKGPETSPLADDHSSIPDRFNHIFSNLGWIYYKSFDSDIALNAINRAESNDINGAELYLINYYNGTIIEFKLLELKSLVAFRQRWPLAQKALIDHKKERYHSSVPVVLALLDGMVTEAYLNAGGYKLNISAEDTNYNAWISVKDHSEALKALVSILRKGRYSTVTEKIDKPYRHGILHGMDLGYDNKAVAAKAWAALFAICDWAEKAEKGLLDLQFDKRINNKNLKINKTNGSLIKDIPSLKNLQQNIENFKSIKDAMPVLRPSLIQLGVDANQIETALPKTELLEAGSEMLCIPDRFNDLFADRGWINYESISYEIAKAVIQKAESGDYDGAEAELVNYYNEETIRSKIKRMRDVKAFRSRWTLAQKALTDYLGGRYHACVPVVLALLDGIVNEAHEKGRGSKLGFSAKDVNLEAWDSISGHAKGLKVMASVFNEDRGKTTVDQITIPYRNGILHGMDLGYDNKMVAAKAWAALFSIRFWAMKAEQGLLNPQPPEKPIMWSQVIDNGAENLELSRWKPRAIKIGQDIPATGGPEMYDAGTPEQKLAEFLSNWKKPKPNFRSMADCVVLDSNYNAKEMPRRIREIYSSKHLMHFEFTDLSDTAPATTIIQTMLVYDEYDTRVDKSVQFIMNNRNLEGGPEILGKAGSNWYIRFWNLV